VGNTPPNGCFVGKWENHPPEPLLERLACLTGRGLSKDNSRTAGGEYDVGKGGEKWSRAAGGRWEKISAMMKGSQGGGGVGTSGGRETRFFIL